MVVIPGNILNNFNSVSLDHCSKIKVAMGQNQNDFMFCDAVTDSLSSFVWAYQAILDKRIRDISIMLNIRLIGFVI